MSKKKPSDQHLDQNSKSQLTRRDFIGGTLIGSGTALLFAKAPAVFAEQRMPYELRLGKSMPLPLNALGKEWTGPGGVGDYKTANGNTHAVVNAAHTFRNSDFDQQVGSAGNTNEFYDLVVVGGGFSGCTTAYTYLKDKPDAKVLILDNHDMFGGEARHNEFEVDGYKLWAPQGSTGAVWPLDEAKKIEMYDDIWAELELPETFEWQEAKNSKLKIPKDNYSPMHLTWEGTDLGWHFDGHKMAVNPWKNRFKDTPLDDDTKNDLIWMETFRQPEERDDWAEWLDSMTYHDFLKNEMGIENKKIHEYLGPFGAAMGMGLGGDVISAYQAFNFLQPGVIGYNRHFGIGDPTDYVYLAQFPGGNTGQLRHIVQRLIPKIFGKTNGIMDVIKNPVDRDQVDNAENAVRMRLGSLVVDVHHDGPADMAERVSVTYLKDGKMHKVVGASVAMCGQQHLNKRVVTDLPDTHKEAMDQYMHSPMMIVNVALRNWKFMDKAGVASVRWFEDEVGGWFMTLRRQMILDGEEPMPLDPEKPTVVTLYNSFGIDGIPIAEQCVAARMKMFGLSYADIETAIRKKFTDMFADYGFDADRDIAGIIVNRQGHAYAATPPGFFFGKDGKAPPSDVIRTPHGRIVFAHAELKGYQMWEGAVHEGERAAHQLSEITS